MELRIFRIAGVIHVIQNDAGFLEDFIYDIILGSRTGQIVFAACGFYKFCETFGFAGAFVLLALFALLMFSTIRIAIKCESLFYRLVCVGFVGMWLFQIFENIGMCIGLMPITGIPLPFISFGSSSMIVQCLIIGIIQSIWRRRGAR